jgi:Immunity protein 70
MGVPLALAAIALVLKLLLLPSFAWAGFLLTVCVLGVIWFAFFRSPEVNNTPAKSPLVGKQPVIIASDPVQTAGRVALLTGSVLTEVGAPAILHALCSSISANLEPAGWGSRFPMVLNRLYQGHLPASACPAALLELRTIERELQDIPVSRVVWDYDDRSRAPSLHYRAPPEAQNLAGYFVTVNGLNLLRAGLIESVESAVEFGDDVRIVTFSSPDDFFTNWQSGSP